MSKSKIFRFSEHELQQLEELRAHLTNRSVEAGDWRPDKTQTDAVKMAVASLLVQIRTENERRLQATLAEKLEAEEAAKAKTKATKSARAKKPTRSTAKTKAR